MAGRRAALTIGSGPNWRRATLEKDLEGANPGVRNNATVSLAKSIAGSGVTVNAISPTAVMTPRLETRLRELAEEHGWTGDLQEYEQHSPPNSDRFPSGG